MQRDIVALQQNDFDLVVVGAGIHGACIARDAALRGLKVALIDKHDLCNATSHNSLKTIHGGIRYLQHFNFKRTLESIKEQHIWLKTAPHITRPLPFLMPTYGFGGRSAAAMAMGIFLYETLGWYRNRGLRKDRKLKRGGIMSSTRFLKYSPHTKRDSLLGGARWTDAQIEQADCAVLELCKQTTRHRGIVSNYVEAINVELNKTNQVTGLKVVNRLHPDGEAFIIKTKTIINAAGPWVCQFLERTSDCFALQVPLTKSMNLVMRRPADDYAVAIQSQRESDAKMGSTKRLYFMIPWLGQSMLGTTHFPYSGNIDKSEYNETEMQKFLDEINQALCSTQFTLDDVLYCYQGFTPANDDASNTKATRAHHSRVIDHAQNGVIGLYSVVSVKWTTARVVAKRAVDMVYAKLPSFVASTTDTTPLLNFYKDKQQLANKSDRDIEKICLFHIEHSLTMQLSDMLLRRSNDLVLDRLNVHQLQIIVGYFKHHFNWSSQQTHQQLLAVYRSGLGRTARSKLQQIIDSL